jgi:hypothetical protein
MGVHTIGRESLGTSTQLSQLFSRDNVLMFNRFTRFNGLKEGIAL